MLIVCPGCATSYRIDAAALGPVGRTVRCARCRSTWFAAAAVAALSTAQELAADNMPSDQPAERRQTDVAPTEDAASPEPMHEASSHSAGEAMAAASAPEDALAQPQQEHEAAA